MMYIYNIINKVDMEYQELRSYISDNRNNDRSVLNEVIEYIKNNKDSDIEIYSGKIDLNTGKTLDKSVYHIIDCMLKFRPNIIKNIERMNDRKNKIDGLLE